MSQRPRLAAFPKCFLDDLLPPRTMTWLNWIEAAATLPHVQGVEVWPPGLDSSDATYLRAVGRHAASHGLESPMVCYSPDFTQPDREARRREVERARSMIDIASELGASTCRVLSGQRRPEVTRDQGVAWTVESIGQLLPLAAEKGVVLVLENHYKDGLWQYPEFAQAGDVFLEILGRLDSDWLGVNFDPSNALIAGEDPMSLLARVADRLVSMHASDRSLQGGTLEDLRRLDADPMLGYAPFVQHGVIGQGLIDYDAIFKLLSSIGFSGWISIEDGQDRERGMEQLRESAEFLHAKLEEYWPASGSR